MADDRVRIPEPWDAIDRDLFAEVERLVDLNVLNRSQQDSLLSEFRSMELRQVGRLQDAGGLHGLSSADRQRAALSTRMWLAAIIEGAGTEHERAVAIRRRIVDLQKDLGVFQEPTLVEPPPDRPSLD